MTLQSRQQIITAHILPNISRSNSNQATSFGQLIGYNISDSFLIFKKALYKLRKSGQLLSIIKLDIP